MFVNWINLLIINYLNGRFLTLAKSEALLISKTPPSPLNLKRGFPSGGGLFNFLPHPSSPARRGSTSPPKSSSPQKRRT